MEDKQLPDWRGNGTDVIVDRIPAPNSALLDNGLREISKPVSCIIQGVLSIS